jgi:hypothetical protein
MSIINTVKQSYTAATTSTVAKAWAVDFKLLNTDGVRVLNAGSVAAMRTAALTMRFTSITIESVNVGLGYALDHTPKTYEETREAMSSLMDNVFDMFDDAGQPVVEAKAVA